MIVANLTDDQIKYERFKELMEEAMVEHQAKDEASGYQMYSYPAFNDRTRAILAKCDSIPAAIERFEIEDPDGWVPDFLRALADRC